MARVFIGMGSNLGDREARLAQALVALRGLPETTVAAVSSLYETAPVGGPPQGPYLNAVAELECALAPLALLEALLAIEAAAGRVRDGERDGPRTLDLDLLLVDARVIESEVLTVPHPRLHLRAFVLEPLAELAPDLLHPRLGATLGELARRVRDSDAVRAIHGGAAWPSSR